MIVRTFDSPFFFSNLFVPAKTGISELSASVALDRRAELGAEVIAGHESVVTSRRVRTRVGEDVGANTAYAAVPVHWDMADGHWPGRLLCFGCRATEWQALGRGWARRCSDYLGPWYPKPSPFRRHRRGSSSRESRAPSAPPRPRYSRPAGVSLRYVPWPSLTSEPSKVRTSLTTPSAWLR
jgi:hypothetical protein